MNAADWALMTIVQATCPTCGDVEVSACDVSVRCCHETMACAYRFCCPQCAMAMGTDAEDGGVARLFGGGGRPERRTLQLELCGYARMAPPVHAKYIPDLPCRDGGDV